MAISPTIVCPHCDSFKVRKASPASLWQRLDDWWNLPSADPVAGRYVCVACGEPFMVLNSAAHAAKHSPNFLGRCRACDRLGTIELVEANHRSELQPDRHVNDLYRCAACGEEFVYIVQKDPSAFYV